MCGCAGGGGSAGVTQQARDYTVILTAPEDCEFSEEILESYKVLLNIVKDRDMHNLVSLNSANVNSLLGLIQSALNYPDNYCLFEAQMNNFKTNNLPKLILYASEYID